MGDEVQLSMSLPLDSDGFLRQECPTCEREFKVWPANNDAVPTPVPDGGYFCPYCGIQAEAGGWFTKAQIEEAFAVAQREVVEPMLDKFSQTLQRNTRGMFSAKVSRDGAPEPQALSEDDDMRRIDFLCHPNDPIKVADDWAGPVCCLICGATPPAH